jgi:GDPmannose 4,6-dehydratase
MSARKSALVIGCNGMDGSYLMELLLEKNYEVFGIIRRASSFNTKRIDHLRGKITLFYGDITDMGSLITAIEKSMNETTSAENRLEIYNLAAMSHVQVSFDIEKYSADVNAVGTLNVLQAVKLCKQENKVKVYQASTSEMYGNSLITEGLKKLNESSLMNPVSPYAIAKLYAYHLTRYYRNAYGMFAVNGILQNHTSPRRGENFVCKKICDYVRWFGEGNTTKPLELGNIDATRDFGHSKDYVRGMWLMMQQEKPDDFVLATGVQTKIRSLVEVAFRNIGIQLTFEGEGVDEVAKIHSLSSERWQDRIGEVVMKINPRYFRPSELTDLVGDPSKAEKELGWSREYTLDTIVEEMVTREI